MNSLNTIEILSPAKINLMLRITGQRDDGYHLLQTYFQLLNWGDTLYFTPTNNDQIEISGEFNNLALEENLIFKALSLLKPYKKNNNGIHIKADKKIPQGSGLGGGSSNAATTLLIMNDLWQCGLSQQQLQEIGLQLGADVPVFVLNSSAMAEGVGEKLRPYKINPLYFVLIFPNIPINTADVFSKPDLKRNEKRITEDTQINQRENWINNCLPVVLKNHPEVQSIYNQASLKQKTYMSGTGSTLFCCFDERHQAKSFINQCPDDWKLQLCHSK